MLIPSIDLMDGKIVQLVQGEKMALEFEDFDTWIRRFAAYPLVQVVDLDAAKRIGNNRVQVNRLVQTLPCQVGGGIHDIRTAQELLAEGARRIIIGSALLYEGAIHVEFAERLAAATGNDRLVFALDSRAGKVAVRGWQELTAISPIEMMRTLAPYCGAFLYTHIDTEGLLCGIPLDVVRTLRQETSKPLIVAGGIRSMEEVEALDAMGVDAVVGMALYTERIHA